MFESDETHHGHRPAVGVSWARTGGPGVASAPASSGPPAFPDVGSGVERELGRMVDLVFVHDVGADVARMAAALCAESAGVGSAEPLPALAAELDAALPGPHLAARLMSLELADLDDHTLVEVLAAWERVASWAQAGSARALGELLERARGSAEHEFAVDGVAARLGLTRYAAGQLVTVAHGAARIPEVVDALAAGVVDRRKAEALVATGRMPDHRRRETVRDLLPEAEHLTVPQLRERMRRAEIAVDPDGVDERRQAARAERFVRLEPVDDAMAYLTAYLPADDAARVMAAVEDVAVPMHRTAGEKRRLDECRADAFVGLVTGALACGGTGDGTPVRRLAVQVTIAASTLVGADDLPATLAGYGPVPATMARALAAEPEATWRRMLTDPATGVLTDLSSRSYRPSPTLRAAVVARDATCTFPGCRVPATRGDLDHVERFDPDAPGAQTHGGNLHALCRTHHRAKTVGGWRVARDPATGVTQWTAPTGHRYDRPPTIADPGHDPGHHPGSCLIHSAAPGEEARPGTADARPPNGDPPPF